MTCCTTSTSKQIWQKSDRVYLAKLSMHPPKVCQRITIQVFIYTRRPAKALLMRSKTQQQEAGKVKTKCITKCWTLSITMVFRGIDHKYRSSCINESVRKGIFFSVQRNSHCVRFARFVNDQSGVTEISMFDIPTSHDTITGSERHAHLCWTYTIYCMPAGYTLDPTSPTILA